jgi:hypothetical protein
MASITDLIPKEVKGKILEEVGTLAARGAVKTALKVDEYNKSFPVERDCGDGAPLFTPVESTALYGGGLLSLANPAAGTAVALTGVVSYASRWWSLPAAEENRTRESETVPVQGQSEGSCVVQ